MPATRVLHIYVVLQPKYHVSAPPFKNSLGCQCFSQPFPLSSIKKETVLRSREDIAYSYIWLYWYFLSDENSMLEEHWGYIIHMGSISNSYTLDACRKLIGQLLVWTFVKNRGVNSCKMSLWFYYATISLGTNIKTKKRKKKKRR